METEQGTDPNVLDVSTEAPEGVGGPGPESEAGATPAQQPTGINPAWEPLREAIGEDYFSTHALPILKGMDESAQTRITNLNSQLKGFEGFAPLVEQGYTPETLQQAMGLVQLIESDPQAIYDRLGALLNQGEDEPQEGLEEFGAGQENAAEIPPHIMARLEAAEQFQQQFLEQQQQFEQQQQEAQQIEAAGKELDQEMSTFLQGNPSFTEADMPELYRMQYELTNQNAARGIQRVATVQEAAAAVEERAAYYRNRSGGAQAPNTLPTTAGGDIPGQQPNVAKMSKQQFEELLANDLRAAKAQS